MPSCPAPLQFRVARKFAENDTAHDVSDCVTPTSPVQVARTRTFPRINLALTSSSVKVVRKYRRFREQQLQKSFSQSPACSDTPPSTFTAKPPPSVVRSTFPKVKLLLPSTGSSLSSVPSPDCPPSSPESPTYLAIRSKPLPRFSFDRLRTRGRPKQRRFAARKPMVRAFHVTTLQPVLSNHCCLFCSFFIDSLISL